MTNWPSISLHPWLAGALELVTGAAFAWLFFRLGSWTTVALWFVARVAVALLLVRVAYYPPGVPRRGHMVSAAIFLTGLTGLMLFVEWRWVWYVTLVLMAAVPAAQYLFLPVGAGALSFVFKPERRWRLMMTTVGMAGIWSAISAASIFHLTGLPSWALLLLGVAGATLTSVLWWAEYAEGADLPPPRLAVVGGVFFLLFAELSWVVLLWPFGYLVNGVLLAWVWYMLWLLLRFYVSPKGIVWRTQAPFFIANGALLLVFILSVARWK